MSCSLLNVWCSIPCLTVIYFIFFPIFQVDALNQEQLQPAAEELDKLLKCRQLKDTLFIVVANKSEQGAMHAAFVSHLDLSRAPYVLYGVKYIDLVSLGAFVIRYFLFSCHISVYVR